MHLYQYLRQQVDAWRAAGYPCDAYPAIAEILDYATLPESTVRRFLREPQLQALETYWYLRLVAGTPHVFDLYRRAYPRTTELLEALRIDSDPIKDYVMDYGLDDLFRRIRTDDAFVKAHGLDSVQETLSLAYPSYILALAMGAGKTILIGAIVASEFAMALEYPGDACPFIQNALVFAPGLTILESLRELAEIDYRRVLPPRLYTTFEATYKLIFTREGEKDLPVIRGSRYNLIVTNTEKIRIQKRTYRHPTWTQLYYEHMLQEYEAEANLRLQAIASLPNLGVFSDEAHHTYGSEVGKDLKRVRETVDYLHGKTDLLCVVNTTGTPYYQRELLRDVVVWYGLSQGIRDDILKSVEGSIYAYDFDNADAGAFVAEVVRDFLTTYGDVRLPNGAPARLALYFPQTKDLRELRPVVEQTLIALGYPVSLVLRNTSNSTEAEIEAFNRLNDPASSHRVILLVNKGTEGWNCPSLFACALARRLRRSSNFVLQASTRCLRQVPGNPHKARIYLSMDNRGALDQQLQETYGETLGDLDRASTTTRTREIVVRKLHIPPLVIKKRIRRVVPQPCSSPLALALTLPELPAETELVRKVYTLAEQPGQASVLAQRDEEAIPVVTGSDLYAAATELATVYRLPALQVARALRALYGAGGTVPATHMPDLRRQIEQQTGAYAVEEEEIEEALALIRPEGFTAIEQAGAVVYTAQITYPKDKEALLLSWRDVARGGEGPGFHYDPYNFDSGPERDYFLQLLADLDQEPDDVADVYFTGAITDPRKTDFYVEYRGTDDRWHRYSPDFVIRRKDGRAVIVEVKAERERSHPIDGEHGRKAMAVRQWADLNPDTLRYEMVFTATGTVPFNRVRETLDTWAGYNADSD